jgi:SAM-dependent methyltransferase
MKQNENGKSFHELKQEWKKIGASWQTGINPWNKNTISYLRLESILQLKEYLDYQDLNLLDLGCDNGLYSHIIGDKFKKVVGIDSDELSIKRALITKKFFEKDGYNLNNIEFNNISFEEYSINPVYQQKKGENQSMNKGHIQDALWNGHKYSDLTLNSIFHEDGINAILACEILHLFDDNLMNIFNKMLENVELIMIQSKFKEKNQWEWDKSEYAQSPATQIKKWNSYENYAMGEIVKYLKQQGFSKIETVSPDSNCSLVIGER